MADKRSRKGLVWRAAGIGTIVLIGGGAGCLERPSGALGSGGGPGGSQASSGGRITVSDGGSAGMKGDGGTAGDKSEGAGGQEGTGGTPVPVPGMIGRPLVFSPTAHSFGLNVVWVHGDPGELRAEVRAVGSEEDFEDQGAPSLPASDLAEWHVSDLEPGTRYEYRVLREQDGERSLLSEGSVMTQRPKGQPFNFGLITDTHIAPRGIEPGETALITYQESTLAVVAGNMLPEGHDFVVNLGDMLDFHAYGFNAPPPSGAPTRDGYLNYRRLLGDVLSGASLFPVIGNWEGENGDYTEEEINRSREQRVLYSPGPDPDTYPQGGSPYEDYYAFEWGDALFVVLNVMTYTKTPHLLSYDAGEADDWTLGEEQLAWFEQTLENAEAKWRFVLIHHAVGGQAGTPEDSAYGRGGGQAARVGEQSIVHDLMLEHGVQIFFYGHDHVFTDMVVDDIHYTLPGSAGAPWKFDSIYTGYETYWLDSGHGRVEVSTDKVKVEFVATDGRVLLNYEL